MPLQTYQYGEAAALPGLNIGVTRHPPRGIKRREWAVRGYCDVWLPLLGPSPRLLAAYRDGRLSFRAFSARYRAEMKRPEPRQAIQLLAAVARRQPVNLGCFCADPARCHRSVLAALVDAAAAELPDENQASAAPLGFASPACSMPEIED